MSHIELSNRDLRDYNSTACTKKNGCLEEPKYLKVLEHDSQCTFKKRDCIGCKEKFILRDIEAHESKCSLFPEACSFCKKKFPRKEIENHKSVCPKAPYKCKNKGCDFKKHREDAESHKKSCSFALINCQYCKLELLRKESETHWKTDCKEFQIACENSGCPDRICRKNKDIHRTTCGFEKIECGVCEYICLRNQKHDCLTEIKSLYLFSKTQIKKLEEKVDQKEQLRNKEKKEILSIISTNKNFMLNRLICKLCNQVLCSKHPSHCSTCKKELSLKLLTPCKECKKEICTDHIKKCATCGSVLCDEDYTKHLVKCPNCNLS